MDVNTITTLISLISGAVGGNLAGAAMSQKNLGPIVNTIAGLVGGGLGKFILAAFGVYTAVTGATNGVPEAASSLDLSQILATIGAGGVGGGALTGIISAIKDSMKTK